jgi:hypothetical protein
MECKNEFWERESAVYTEGHCPICMDAELRRIIKKLAALKHELQEQKKRCKSRKRLAYAAP